MKHIHNLFATVALLTVGCAADAAQQAPATVTTQDPQTAEDEWHLTCSGMDSCATTCR